MTTSTICNAATNVSQADILSAVSYRSPSQIPVNPKMPVLHENSKNVNRCPMKTPRRFFSFKALARLPLLAISLRIYMHLSDLLAIDSTRKIRYTLSKMLRALSSSPRKTMPPCFFSGATVRRDSTVSPGSGVLEDKCWK